MSKSKLLKEIEEWFNNHSEKEIEEKLQQYGFFDEVEEIPKNDDDLPIKEALNNLYNDIYSKGEYLRDSTYSEYDHCFDFARRLKKLINRMYG